MPDGQGPDTGNKYGGLLLGLYFAKAKTVSLASTVSFAGDPLTKQASRALTGTLSFVGAALNQTSRALTGTLSFVGAAINQTRRTLPSTLSFAGVLLRRFPVVNLTATLSFAGAVLKQSQRLLTATLSFSPKVLAVTSTNFGSATTSHLVNMPSSVRSGDLLLAMFANSATATVTTPTGWALLDSVAQSGVRPSLYVRWSDGTEGGTQVDFVTSVAKQATAQVYAVSNVSGYNWSGFATGVGTAPDAGNLLTGWETGRNLYLTFMAENDDNVPSATPTNYLSTTTSVSAAGAANTVVGLASAYRLSDVDTEDSGAWTVASVNWAATTIGLRPYAAGYRDAVKADSPSAYWRMDDRGSLVTMVAEVGANGAYGNAPTGAQETAIADGDKAVLFNGTTQYASSNTALDLSSTNKVTVEFLLNWPAYANNDDLAFEHSVTSGSNIGFYANPNQSDGSFGVSMSDGVGGFNSINFARPSAGVWHHYAFLFDRTAPMRNQVRAIVDGVEVVITSKPSTTVMSGNFGNFVLYLMSRGGTTLFGNGTLDEFAVYPTLLSQARIAEHVKNISPKFLQKQTRKPLAGTLSFPAGPLARTVLVGTSSGASTPFGTGAFITGAFTPPDDSLLVVAISGFYFPGGSTWAPTIQDSVGLTWTQRTTHSRTTAVIQGITTWTAPVRTGVSMTITADHGSESVSVYSVSVVAYTGYNRTTPVGATADDTTLAVDGPDSITGGLSGSPALTSEVIAYLNAVVSTAGLPSATPGATFTEIQDIGTNNQCYLEVEVRSNSTSTTVDWADVESGSPTLNAVDASALEIRAADVTLSKRTLRTLLGSLFSTTAFPIIRGSARLTNGSTATTSASVGLPTAVEPGDLLIVAHRSDAGTNHTYPGGWTRMFFSTADASNDGFSIAWKLADGTEDSTSITVTQDSGKFASMSVAVFACADPTVTPPEVSSVAFGADANPNPPSLSPAGGQQYYKWLTIESHEGEQTTGSETAPTNYANFGTASSGTVGATDTNCQLNISGRDLYTFSEDPGTYGITVADDWMAVTLGIYPAPTFFGNLVKQTRKPLTGTLSFAGNVAKQTRRSLAATLSFVGDLVTLYIPGATFTQAFSATLSFSGAVTKKTARSLTGTLSFVGALPKQTSRTLTGTLSFVGALTKQTSRALAGTLSFVGAVTVTRLKLLTATLSFAGAVTKQTGKALAATLQFNQQDYATFILSLKPLSYWRLNDNAANTTLLDELGASNGTDSVNTNVSSVAGVFGTAFGGVSAQRAELATDLYRFLGNLPFSVAIWVKPNVALGTMYQLTQSAADSSAFNGWSITTDALTGGRISFWRNGPTAVRGFLRDGVWSRIIATYDGTNASIYRNGVLMQSLADSFSIPTLSTKLRLNGHPNGVGSADFDFDELAIFDYALDPATIAADYSIYVGSFTKRTARSLTAALSFAGAVLKRTARTLTGTLSFSGLVNLSKTFLRTLTGTLSFSGAMTNQTRRALTGSLSFVGAITSRQVSRALTGTLSFVGAVTKQTSRALSGTLSFSGLVNLSKTFLRTFTGTLSFAGSLTKSTNRTLAGTLSFAGALPRVVQRTLTGTLSFVGAMTKQTRRALSGTLSFSGAMTKQTGKSLAGTLSFAGAFTRRTGKALTATLSFVGTLLRQNMPVHLSATLSFTGATFKQTARLLTATLSFSGLVNLSKTFLRTFTGTLSFSGAMTKQTGKSLAGTLSFAGAITRRTFRALTATLSFVGTLLRRTPVNLVATLSFSGATFKQTRRALTAATLSFVGAMTKQAQRTLTGTLSFAGAFTRRTGKALAATLSFAGALLRQTPLRLNATLSFSGTTLKQTRRALTATLSFVGFFVAARVNNFFKTFTATLTFSGAVTKRTARTLPAALSFQASLRRMRAFFISLTRYFAREEPNILRAPHQRIDSIEVVASRITGQPSYTVRIGSDTEYRRSPVGEETSAMPRVLSNNVWQNTLSDNLAIPPADPLIHGATVTLTLTDPNGSVVLSAVAAPEVGSTGTYRYESAASVCPIPGVYKATWDGTDLSGRKHHRVDLVQVTLT